MSKAKVLIVEDSAISVSFLSDALLKAGYEVAGVADSADTAVEKAMALRPDIIMMDIMLKGEADGIQATEAITSKLDIPIVFLSSQADMHTVERARASGARGYLSKPWKDFDLYSTIEVVLFKYQADKVIKRSEEMFRLTFRNAKDAVFLYDAVTGLVSDCNLAAEQLTCLPREEIIGMNILSVFTEQAAKKFDGRFFSAAGDKCYSGEAVVVTKSGATKPVDITSSIVSIGGQAVVHCAFRDISERKMADNLLREKEERWRALIDNSQDMIALVDSDLKTTFLGQSVTRVLGYSTEIDGTNFMDYVHQGDAQGVRKVFDELMADPSRIKQFEFKFRHRDFSWRVLEARAKNHLEFGPVKKIVLNIRDITLKKMVENARRQSEDIYKKITESSLHEILLVGADGRIFYANQAASAQLGVMPYLCINKNLKDVYEKEKAEEYLAHIKEVVSSDKTLLYETVFVVGNSRLAYVSDFQPIKDDAGTISAVLIISTNVTGLQKYVSALQESDQRWDEMFQHMPLGIFKTSLDGRLLQANAALVAMMGYSGLEDALANIKMLEKDIYVKPEDRVAMLKQVTSLGKEHTYETVFRKKDGSPLPVSVTVAKMKNQSSGEEYLQGYISAMAK